MATAELALGGAARRTRLQGWALFWFLAACLLSERDHFFAAYAIALAWYIAFAFAARVTVAHMAVATLLAVVLVLGRHAA